MPKISILKKNKIKKLLRFGLYTSLIFTVIFYIDTNDFYISQVFIGFVFGIFIGLLEEITSHRRYVTVSLPLQFLVKFLGIILIAFIMLSVILLIYDLKPEDIKNFARRNASGSTLHASNIQILPVSSMPE